MVIVYGGVAVDRAKVEELTAAASAFEAACRSEPGCIEYVLAWRIDEPNRIQLLEVWESEEAWRVHRTREHVLEWAALVAAASLEAPAFTHHTLE
jgi:quinol monooxygenase YgiN